MAKRDVSPDCTHEISQSGAYSFFWVSIMQHVEFSPMVGINKAWGYQPRSTVISVAATKGRDRTKYTSNPTKTSLHGYESWGPVGVSDYIIYHQKLGAKLCWLAAHKSGDHAIRDVGDHFCLAWKYALKLAVRGPMAQLLSHHLAQTPQLCHGLQQGQNVLQLEVSRAAGLKLLLHTPRSSTLAMEDTEDTPYIIIIINNNNILLLYIIYIIYI